MSASVVPDHVAAYAAAMDHGGWGDWSRIAETVSLRGLGTYPAEVLAQAATTWAEATFPPGAIIWLRALDASRRASAEPALGAKVHHLGGDE